MTTQTSRHLFEQAAGLLSLYQKRKPRQTELRRAISAAYYGIFHFTAEQAADMYVGATHSSAPRYALAYRGITHTWLRSLCNEIGKPIPSAQLKAYLPPKGLGEDMRRFAAFAADLQESRHAADYDMQDRFARRDAQLAIEAARNAVERFRAAPLQDRQIFLALLLFPPRGRGA